MAVVSKGSTPLYLPAAMTLGVLRPDVFVAEDRLCDIAETATLFSSPSRAICWHCRHNDVIITGGTGEYTYGLSYEDSQHRMFDVEQVEDLIIRPTREERVILVVGARCSAQYEGQLPRPSREERHEGLVWAEYPPPARSPFSESADGAGVP